MYLNARQFLLTYWLVITTVELYRTPSGCLVMVDQKSTRIMIYKKLEERHPVLDRGFCLLLSILTVEKIEKFKLQNWSNISPNLQKCGKVPLVYRNPICKNHLPSGLCNWSLDLNWPMYVPRTIYLSSWNHRYMKCRAAPCHFRDHWWQRSQK